MVISGLILLGGRDEQAGTHHTTVDHSICMYLLRNTYVPGTMLDMKVVAANEKMQMIHAISQLSTASGVARPCVRQKIICSA